MLKQLTKRSFSIKQHSTEEMKALALEDGQMVILQPLVNEQTQLRIDQERSPSRTLAQVVGKGSP